MLLLSFIAIGWANQGQTQRTFEYKTEDKCFDDKRLNALGTEGWELAGMTESGYGGRHCIFKRAKN